MDITEFQAPTRHPFNMLEGYKDEEVDANCSECKCIEQECIDNECTGYKIRQIMGEFGDNALNAQDCREIMKWWLISDDNIAQIRDALTAPTHEANDYNCQDWPPGTRCAGCLGDEKRKAAIYALDTGLHLTNCVPADWR